MTTRLTTRLRFRTGDRLPMMAALFALILAARASAEPPPEGATTTKPAPADTIPVQGTETKNNDDLRKQVAEQEKRTAELEARLQAAEESVAQAEARQEESKIRLYGFSEMGFRKAWINDDRSYFKNITEDAATFLLGSTNLYLEAQPHPKLRSLNEVRFTLYPNGVPGSDFKPTTAATIYDVTSGTGRNKVQWSGIVLERAIVEWKQSDAFKVMVGYFLTPYGIWNVDHGSPTLISSALPGFFAQEYFPTRLTGVQLLGAVTTGDWELGYRAYITNGRSRVLFDNQNNKLLGGRLYATLRFNRGSLTLGGSAFTGTYLDQDYALRYNPALPYQTFHVETTKTVEYAEWGAAGDISLDAGPLRVRAEFVSNRTDYANGYRAQTMVPGTYYPDRLRFGAYGIVAYRLPWLGLEPYVYVERDHRPDGTSTGSALLSGGLNINLTPSARIKLQYFRVLVIDATNDAYYHANVNDFDLVDARFVVAY
jgi:hypothetical protein